MNDAGDLSDIGDLSEAYDLLYRLGLRAGSTHFFHTAYALYLAAKQPERLRIPSRWLYPQVAAQYDIPAKSVEGSIRLASAAAWHENPALLRTLTGRAVPQPQPPERCLAILAVHLRPENKE